MKITYLPKDPAIIKTISEWMYNHWFKSDPTKTLAEAFETLTELAHAESTQVPLMIVALNEQGQLIGFGCITDDGIGSQSHLTPWVSGIYVDVKERNKGVGSAICRHLVEEVKRLGFKKAYLFTESQEKLYSSLGWKTLCIDQNKGMDVTVMETDVK